MEVKINKIVNDLTKEIEGSNVSVDIDPEILTMTITVVASNVDERKKWEIHKIVQDYCIDNLDEYESPIDLTVMDSATDEVVEEFKTIRSDGEDWDRGYSDEELEGYIVSPWQSPYMEEPGFSKVAKLINDDEGFEIYGPQAYVIPISMIKNWNEWKSK